MWSCLYACQSTAAECFLSPAGPGEPDRALRPFACSTSPVSRRQPRPYKMSESIHINARAAAVDPTDSTHTHTHTHTHAHTRTHTHTHTPVPSLVFNMHTNPSAVWIHVRCSLIPASFLLTATLLLLMRLDTHLYPSTQRSAGVCWRLNRREREKRWRWERETLSRKAFRFCLSGRSSFSLTKPPERHDDPRRVRSSEETLTARHKPPECWSSISAACYQTSDTV